MEFDFSAALSGADLVQTSILIAIIAVVIVVLALVIFFIRNKKSPEERAARAVLKRLELARKGKLKKSPPQKSWASPAEPQGASKEKKSWFSHAEKQQAPSPSPPSSPQTPFSSSETTSSTILEQPRTIAVEPSGFSLKQMLIEKFKPSIEKQLKTSIEVLNLSASGENFFAQVDIAGTKLLLTLDPAGKIIDYKKV